LINKTSIRIEYSDHLKLRLQARYIAEELPELIYRKAKQRYFDHETERHVAVMSVMYHQQHCQMMIAFDQSAELVTIVTIHPIEKQQIKHRLSSGRWTNEPTNYI